VIDLHSTHAVCHVKKSTPEDSWSPSQLWC